MITKNLVIFEAMIYQNVLLNYHIISENEENKV